MEFCIGSVADITHVLDLRERLVSVVGSLQEGKRSSLMVVTCNGSIVPEYNF